MNAKPVNAATRKTLLRDIRGLIEQTRLAVAVTVNAGYGDEIVATLSRQLSWSHFKELLPLEKPLLFVGTGANSCWK